MPHRLNNPRKTILELSSVHDRQHSRGSSISSLGNGSLFSASPHGEANAENDRWPVCYTHDADSDDEEEEEVDDDMTPSSPQRRRLTGPENSMDLFAATSGISILACTSPEIHALCQQPAIHLASATAPAEELPNHTQETQKYSMSSNGLSLCNLDTAMDTSPTSTTAASFGSNTDYGPQRVSLTPRLNSRIIGERERSPLKDISAEGITLSLRRIRLYPSTPPSLDESNKENVPPAPPTKLKKSQDAEDNHRRPGPGRPRGLHRRVSFDMLPSPSQIQEQQYINLSDREIYGTSNSSSPSFINGKSYFGSPDRQPLSQDAENVKRPQLTRRPSHRRNTQQLVMHSNR